MDPSNEYRRGCCHDTSLTAPSLVLGSRLFELGPRSESGRFFQCGLKRCVTAIKLNSIMITLFNVPTTYVHHLPWFHLLEIVKVQTTCDSWTRSGVRD